MDTPPGERWHVLAHLARVFLVLWLLVAVVALVAGGIASSPVLTQVGVGALAVAGTCLLLSVVAALAARRAHRSGGS